LVKPGRTLAYLGPFFRSVVRGPRNPLESAELRQIYKKFGTNVLNPSCNPVLLELGESSCRTGFRWLAAPLLGKLSRPRPFLEPTFDLRRLPPGRQFPARAKGKFSSCWTGAVSAPFDLHQIRPRSWGHRAQSRMKIEFMSDAILQGISAVNREIIHSPVGNRPRGRAPGEAHCGFGSRALPRQPGHATPVIPTTPLTQPPGFPAAGSGPRQG
jgi:hypothetical protein